MDDFNASSLHESRNEWSSRLVTILTPLIFEGFKSIFDESFKLCLENNETQKYLMTFQNFISRIPQWNDTIIENEKIRILNKSGCHYLEDLITCVHVIHLKMLTVIRAGQKQKQINIKIPKLNDFIHKIYIHVARKLYKNVYLFEINIPPLQIQKHNREFEIIIQECILNTIRDSIPVEEILTAYMHEEEVVEEIKEQIIANPEIEKQEKERKEREIALAIAETKAKDPMKLKFDDKDYIKTHDGQEVVVPSPKDIKYLNNKKTAMYSKDFNEENEPQKNNYDEDEDDEDDDDNIRLIITDENVNLKNYLDEGDILDQETQIIPDLLIDDVEML